MGTPKRQRRKFTRPTHPWLVERITEEKELCAKYGLKNRKEIWKAKSKLARIRVQGKKLLALTGEQAEKNKKELIEKLNVWGIKVTSIDDILALDTMALLDRRLETVVFRKGLTTSPKQARQLIAHNNVYVGSHKVSIPSYIVLAAEEDTVRLADHIKVQKVDSEESKETH
jgi:small subunit ribosomal protein S4